MAIQRNTPFAQATSDSPQGRRTAGFQSQPAGLRVTSLSRDLSPMGSEDMANPNSRHNVEHRTFFDDLNQVEQWVVSSVIGSIDNSLDVHPGTYQQNDTYNDVQTTGPGPLESSCPMIASASHFSSMSSQNGVSGFTEGPSQESGVAHARGFFASDFDSIFSLDSAFPDDTYSVGDASGSDKWAASTSQPNIMRSSVDMVYTTSADSHRLMNEAYPEETDFPPYWSKSQSHGPNRPSDYSRFSATHNPWSPPAPAMVPSDSSSYSQGSLFPHAESPTSYSTQEDLLPLDPSEGISPLTVEAPLLMSYAPYQFDSKVKLEQSRFVEMKHVKGTSNANIVL